MDWNRLRELVRIRYQLRDLQSRRERETAGRLLERMSALAAEDAVEHRAIAPEMLRWRSVFGLEGSLLDQ